MPIDLSLAEITADKTLREQLLPCLERLRALTTKVDHTVFLLDHEYLTGALAIYKALKAFRSSVRLVELLAALKLRFVRERASRESSNPTPEAPGHLKIPKVQLQFLATTRALRNECPFSFFSANNVLNRSSVRREDVTTILNAYVHD